MLHIKALVHFFMLAFILLVACSDISSKNPITTESKKGAWQVWKAAHIHNYKYQLQIYGWCAGCPRSYPVVIEVRKKAVTKVEYTPTDDFPFEGPVPDEDFDFYPTIEGLFDKIADFQKDPTAIVEVEYDEQHGYPTKIEVDTTEPVADFRISYFIENFQVINRN